MVFAREGSQGDAVRQLQTMLNFVLAAKPDLAIDGVFGPKTRARVVEFQRKVRITADGVVGPITAAALVAASSTRLVSPTTVSLL